MKTVFLTTLAGVILAKFAAPMISKALGRPISA
jgi:hypothetical protein